MMKQSIQKVVALSILALVMFGATNAMAQRGGGRGQGGPGGPGGFDPSQFMDRMMDRMQEQLAFSDAEWKVVRPMVEDVMEKQRSTRGPGMGGMMFGRGGRGGRGGDQNAGGPGRGGRGPFGGGDFPEQEALQEAIDNDAAADVIKSKLAAYKKAVASKEADLKKAQDKLRAVLSVKQEAQLTLFGMI